MEPIPSAPGVEPGTGQGAHESACQGAGLRVGFLVIGRRRPGFDPDWGRQMEGAARAATAAMEFEAVWSAKHAVDEASLRRALEELRQAQCHTLVVLQPTMGDGRLTPILAQLWNDPLVFWATPERPDSPKVSSCSLVGTHLFASTLRQFGQPFEIAYGHPDDPQTRQQLTIAARLAAAGVKLRRSKIGLVGQHAPGFINMRADPVQMSHQLGVQLHEFSLQEFFDLVQAQPDQAVQDDVARVMALGLPLGDGLAVADLATNSRYYLVMQALLQSESLDALAVRCWPELPQRFGQWPYLAMARLADQGQVVALEGDVDGAICCLIGRLLDVGVGYISDWLEHDRHTVTLWHPGHAPQYLCQPGTARLGRHFNNAQPLVINAPLVIDRPITIFRLWRCDGVFRMTACDARTAPPRRELAGVYGLAVIEDRDVHEWFEALCHEGMPHHVTLLLGHHTGMLKRLARQLRIQWVS